MPAACVSGPSSSTTLLLPEWLSGHGCSCCLNARSSLPSRSAACRPGMHSTGYALTRTAVGTQAQEAAAFFRRYLEACETLQVSGRRLSSSLLPDLPISWGRQPALCPLQADTSRRASWEAFLQCDSTPNLQDPVQLNEFLDLFHDDQRRLVCRAAWNRPLVAITPPPHP